MSQGERTHFNYPLLITPKRLSERRFFVDTQDQNLTPMRRQIIETLYVIRGANADVLAQFIHRTLACTPQQKKQIINQLHRLKEKKLVTSEKLEGKHAGSMYTLSTTGSELAKRLLDIKPLQKGHVWLKYCYPLNQKITEGLSDWDYKTYKPPVKQHKHHHLILKSIVSLFGLESNLAPFYYRLTLDAYKKYQRDGKEYLLRPDVEFKVDEGIYTLEVDRSTEAYHQLVQKFKNYKHYMEYAKTKEALFPIRKIIFVIGDTERDYGMSRRWGTIFKAYLEGMGVTTDYGSWPDVDIILTTVSSLASVVEHDITMRQIDSQKRANSVASLVIANKFTDKTFVRYKSTNDHCAIYLKEQNSDLLYTASYPYYTSAFYRYLTDFYSNGKDYFDVSYSSSSYVEMHTLLISTIKRQNWVIDWGTAKVDKDFRNAFDKRLKLVQYLKHDN